MQMRVLSVACLLIVILQGCKCFAPDKQEPLTISRQEKQFAESLAHFSQGLVYVSVEGSSSSKALMEYRTALQMDQETAPDFIIPRLLSYAITSEPNTPDMEDIDRFCTDYYTSKLQKETQNPLHYVTLARIYFKQNKDSKAIATLKKGLQTISQNSPIKLYCRLQGQEFFMCKEYTRTVACFELLSDRNAEQYERFHFVLGELDEALNQIDKAIQNYTIAAEGEDPVPEAFIKLALIHAESDANKAIAIMTNANKVFPDDPRMLFFLAYFQSINKDYQASMNTYDKISRSFENGSNSVLTTDFYLNYGATCEQAGELEKAAEIFEKGINVYPDNHQTLNYLAYMWAEKNIEIDKARGYAERAVKLDENNGAYIDTLGWICFRQLQFNDALVYLTKAHELMPEDAVIMEHLGEVHKALNNDEKAILWWKESFIANQKNERMRKKLELNNINIHRVLKEAKRRKSKSSQSESK